ncbi:hypothetical protein [Haloferula sp. BvORR071]|uniref:hypothetical protein n=1 Tax=Haloferula sp. BvORR071 TaxID=1396141 RepID=UPI000550C4FE|nr:hypothetical protein [Haloferula sp. BvORR071]
MPSKKTIALLAASTLGVATWAGYRAECRVMDSAGNKPITFQSVVRRVTAPKSRTQQIDKLNAIRQRAGRTAMSAGDTKTAWEIIRALTAEDVKACLDEIPLEPPRNVNQALVRMLFFRWGQLDPQAAAEAAVQAPYARDSNLILAVATAWADRDPEGAMRWADKLGPGAVQNVVGYAGGMMLMQQDPATALERAITEFPGALNSVAMALATREGETEESRQVTLLRLAGLKNNRQALNYFLQGMALPSRKDPGIGPSLLAEIDRSGLPADRIASIKSSLDSCLAHYVPPQPGTNGAQPVTNEDYFRWSYRDPAKAFAWAEENGRTDLLEPQVKREAMDLLRSSWQPGVRQEVRNPAVKSVVQQYQGWQRLDPAAAEAWLKTMPADLRKHLSPSTLDATR